MANISQSVCLAIALLCLATIQCFGQQIIPILPSDFATLNSANGQPIMSNAGASNGVQNGQVEGIPLLPVAGAINRVLPHPKDANILYVGAVNGGVWKTTNALAAYPNWVALTDNLPCLSIGAMSFDYSDPSFNTILVAFGSQSSISKQSGYQVGIIKTTDGGQTWTNLGSDALYGYRLHGVIGNGDLISVCAVGWGYVPTAIYQNGATFHSEDGGITWMKDNDESCTDMVSDISMPMTLYRGSLKTGIAVSRDGGKSWPEHVLPNYPGRFNDTLLNIRIGLRNFGNAQNPDIVMYVGALSRTLQGLLRAENKGAGQPWTWSELDKPVTNDNGTWNGLNPVKPGGQGTLHFSIAGDNNDKNIVYVGGDRQPTGGNATNPGWPNGIGASEYSGRLFKCNNALPSGEQCIALTHMYAANNSAPHADSRHLIFDASGRLMEGDDGGVYFRLNPTSTTSGWGSAIGNLQVQEAQAATYVGSNTFVTGNQDTGTTFGTGGDGSLWDSLGLGDGAVCRTGHLVGSPNYELYWSYPFLGGFASTTFTNGKPGAVAEKDLWVIGTVNSLQRWISGTPPPIGFYQNYCANRFDPKRLFFGISFDKFAFESFDGGASVYQYGIAPTVAGQIGNGACVYGGMVNGVGVANATYFAGLDQLARRNSTNPSFTITAWPPVGIRWPQIADVAALPSNWNIVVVLGLYGDVGISYNAGDSFEVIPALRLGVPGMMDSIHRKVMVLEGSDGNLNILVCGRGGVFALRVGQSTWTRLSGIPNAVVYDMGYDPIDDLLWVSTLGRSVWKITTASVTVDDAITGRPAPTIPAPPPSLKKPNFQTLTYVFAALTVVLFLAALVLGVAFITTWLKHRQPEEERLLENKPFIST